MIKIKDLDFTYENKKSPAIEVSNLHIRKGEFILLSGSSGSGKSTLTKTINALIPHFFEGKLNGEIFLDGKDAKKMSVCDVSRIVSSVFQDPSSQFFTEDVNGELAFTCENFGLGRDDILNNISKAVELTEIEDLLGIKLDSLSGGQKQKVAIATSLTLPVKVLILDEPSSNLDYHSIERLKYLLGRLKDKGFTILIAEHRLYYLKELFDRFLYMKDGKIIHEYTNEEFLNLDNKYLHDLGLRSLNLFSNKSKTSSEGQMETLAIFKNISFRYEKSKVNTLEDVNIELKSGEIVALVGTNGSGKTTLAKILTGINKSPNAQFTIGDKEVKRKNLHCHVNFVMQDVSYQLFGDTAFNELKINDIDIKDLDERIESSLKSLNLYEFKKYHPFSLSMGQRQRLVIASTYVCQKPITIFDEPTSGLDFLSMRKVALTMEQIAQDNKAVLVITHDYELIANTCDRVLLLKDGKISKDIRLHGNGHLLEEVFLNDLK